MVEKTEAQSVTTAETKEDFEEEALNRSCDELTCLTGLGSEKYSERGWKPYDLDHQRKPKQLHNQNDL